MGGAVIHRQTWTETKSQAEERQALCSAVWSEETGYVGTAPSSCCGLISGPSARHEIKHTGESRVRLVYKRDGDGASSGFTSNSPTRVVCVVVVYLCVMDIPRIHARSQYINTHTYTYMYVYK